MATGPEHYKAAERCLSSVDDDSDLSLALLAEAQAHATLALAAATALDGAGPGGGMPDSEWQAWAHVARTQKPAG